MKKGISMLTHREPKTRVVRAAPDHPRLLRVCHNFCFSLRFSKSCARRSSVFRWSADSPNYAQSLLPRSSGPCPSIVGPRSFKNKALSRSCSPIVGALPVDRGPQELQKQRQSSIREKENKIKSKSKIKTEAAHEREQ